MKKKKLILVVSISVMTIFSTYRVNADGWDGSNLPIYVNGSHEEVYGHYDGYTLYDDSIFESHTDNYGWWVYGKSDNGLIIEFDSSSYDYSNATIRIPDKINKSVISCIRGSCNFKKFDLNPKNKYMECVDNVLFTKDRKKLLSYAEYDERTEYSIPEGTESIGDGAFMGCNNLISVFIPEGVESIGDAAFMSCNNLKSVFIPASVKEITSSVFYSGDNLTELCFSSFDIKINQDSLGPTFGKPLKTQLKSSVQPTVSVSENKLIWDKVPNASYYEIYQKLNNGEYKLIKTTKALSCKFTTLKKGKSYTFAVKPVAVIPAANYNKEKDEDIYPESFTIEGTMSEDIVVRG